MHPLAHHPDHGARTTRLSARGLCQSAFVGHSTRRCLCRCRIRTDINTVYCRTTMLARRSNISRRPPASAGRRAIRTLLGFHDRFGRRDRQDVVSQHNRTGIALVITQHALEVVHHTHNLVLVLVPDLVGIAYQHAILHRHAARSWSESDRSWSLARHSLYRKAARDRLLSEPDREISGSIRLSPRYRLDNQVGLMGVAA